MEIKSTTTIKFDKEERDTLVDAARILDDVFSKDVRSALQFDVTSITLVDADDIATMLRKLVSLSDEGRDLPVNIEI